MTTNPYFVAGARSAAFSLGASVSITIPKGPTGTALLDYISAFIAFQANFVQDPAFFIDFMTGGLEGEHVLPAYRVATTAPKPEGYQLYFISNPLNVAVDQGTGITFLGSYIPPDTNATITVHVSGHFV